MKDLLVVSFLHGCEVIWLHTNIIIIIVSTQMVSNYYYLTQIIQFKINHLFADNEVVTSIAI